MDRQSLEAFEKGLKNKLAKLLAEALARRWIDQAGGASDRQKQRAPHEDAAG